MVLFFVVFIFIVIIIIIIITINIIIIITVKVDISRNLEPELELRRRRLLDQLQEDAWLVSIPNIKNTIIAFKLVTTKTGNRGPYLRCTFLNVVLFQMTFSNMELKICSERGKWKQILFKQRAFMKTVSSSVELCLYQFNFPLYSF